MKFKIYNFDKKRTVSKNESEGFSYTVTDYWQYYTTGVESLVNNKDFFKTDRLTNERIDVLAYKFYNDADYSDVIVASNNDAFLWSCPFDYAYGEKIAQNKMNYFKKLHKRELTDDEKVYWNAVFLNDVANLNEMQSTVVAPKFQVIQKVVREIREYFYKREVK